MGTAAANVVNLTSLTDKQFQQAFVGNTVIVGPGAYLKNTSEPDTAEVYFAADGTLAGKWLKPIAGTSQTDTGTYTVDADGKVCNHWKQWGDYCQYFYPIKDHYLMISTDQEEMVAIPKTNIKKNNIIK